MDMWKECGHTASLPSTDSDALSDTNLLVLSELSRKFRRSWFVPAATSLLVLSSLSASSCHTWELDAASFWFWVSRCGFPRILLKNHTFLTKCSEYPRTVDALGLNTIEELASIFETKFNVGFDFATIISSLVPSCFLFAICLGNWLIFWELQPELQWLMLHKWTRSFHSPRVKLPFVTMSANWCLVSCQITNQMQLCGFWIHVSLLDFCLQWSIQERRAELDSWFGCWCACLMMCHATSLPILSLCILSIVWKKNGTLQKPDPKDREL